MPAVWLLRAELHGRWRAWLAWVVAAGAVSGLVLAATAGARRADSALERYRAFSHATDVFVGTGAVFGGQGLDLARVRGLPEVAAATRGILPAQDIRARSGRSVSSSVAIEISPDAGNLRAIDRPKLLAGRLPAPERDDEAIADRRAVRILGLGLGDIVHARLQVGRTARPGPAVALRIVGIRPDSSSANTTSFLSTTPAFYRAHGGRALLLAAWRSSLKIRLRHGSADLPAFQRRTERIAGGRDFEFVPVELEVAKMQSPLHLQAEALGIVAALAAFGGLLVLGGGLARMMELKTRKHPMLFALGMTRRQIAWLTIGRAAIAGLAAAAISVPVAIALSPLTPIERARDYEPHPGVAVDGIVLGVGAAIVIAAALLSGLAAAARAVGTRSLPAGAETGSGGSWVAALGRAGLPPPLVAGVRMAAPSSHSPARGPARDGRGSGPGGRARGNGADLLREPLPSAPHSEAVGPHLGLRELPGIRHRARPCEDAFGRFDRRPGLWRGGDARHRRPPRRRRRLRPGEG